MLPFPRSGIFLRTSQAAIGRNGTSMLCFPPDQFWE
jgi:hypothetical protein